MSHKVHMGREEEVKESFYYFLTPRWYRHSRDLSHALLRSLVREVHLTDRNRRHMSDIYWKAAHRNVILNTYLCSTM